MKNYVFLEATDCDQISLALSNSFIAELHLVPGIQFISIGDELISDGWGYEDTALPGYRYRDLGTYGREDLVVIKEVLELLAKKIPGYTPETFKGFTILEV